MFNNIDYDNLEDIYIKPYELYETHTIDKLTFAFSYIGKGIMEGCDVHMDTSTGNITVLKGVILADNCVIKLKDNVTFNLTDFDDYSSLTTDTYYLVFFYQYDPANPDDKGFFDLIKISDYTYQDDPRYVILSILEIVVT